VPPRTASATSGGRFPPEGEEQERSRPERGEEEVGPEERARRPGRHGLRAHSGRTLAGRRPAAWPRARKRRTASRPRSRTRASSRSRTCRRSDTPSRAGVRGRSAGHPRQGFLARARDVTRWTAEAPREITPDRLRFRGPSAPRFRREGARKPGLLLPDTTPRSATRWIPRPATSVPFVDHHPGVRPRPLVTASPTRRTGFHYRFGGWLLEAQRERGRRERARDRTFGRQGPSSWEKSRLPSDRTQGP